MSQPLTSSLKSTEYIEDRDGQLLVRKVGMLEALGRKSFCWLTQGRGILNIEEACPAKTYPMSAILTENEIGLSNA